MMGMKTLKRVVIKEELVALTGDGLSALILNQLLYWSERVRDFDEFIEEEEQRGGDPNVEPTRGWIYKTASELGEEIMLGVSGRTVQRRLDDLVEAGYIDRRESPHKWDRTLQYRPNIYAIQRGLARLGYVLDGYPLQFRFEESESPPQDAASRSSADTGPEPHDDEPGHRVDSRRHGVHSRGQPVASKGRGDGTVPEITTENTDRNNNGRDGDVAVAALSETSLSAFEALQELGLVPDSLARRYALATPEAAIRWADYARREDLGAAYVRKRLDAGDEPPPRKRRTTAPPQAVKVYR